MRTKIVKSATGRGDAHTGWQSGDPSPKLNTRVRRVFPTDEVPHKWAHQSQWEARNPQGNLFFEGSTIYSYRRSWPLARIYTKRGGAPLVLTNAARYSVTTGQHQSAVNSAARHLTQVEVPHCAPEYRDALTPEQHRANFDHLTKAAADHLAAAWRAQRCYNVDWRRRQASEALLGANQYSDFFGLRRKVPAFPEVEWASAYQRAQRLENPDPASLDKRERQRAKRQEAKQERERKALERSRLVEACGRTSWRLGDPWGWIGASRGDPIMLRLNGENIETNMGARIPAEQAPEVWAFVQRVLGRGFKPNGLRGPRIGDYQLDRIDADGTLHVGCHAIPHSELRMMARALKLAA